VESSGGKKKILLVDDSTTVRHVVKLMLRFYDVVTASNGNECIEKAIAERPDLILLDVIMPELDGLQACKRLRARRETSDLPILMMTTRGAPGHIEAGYESGCTEYITKPLDGPELLAKVRTFIGE
jgi:DNA-binding response OmpR family regulator